MRDTTFPSNYKSSEPYDLLATQVFHRSLSVQLSIKLKIILLRALRIRNRSESSYQFQLYCLIFSVLTQSLTYPVKISIHF